MTNLSYTVYENFSPKFVEKVRTKRNQSSVIYLNKAMKYLHCNAIYICTGYGENYYETHLLGFNV